MPNIINAEHYAASEFTLTSASLADGSGRQATLLNNTDGSQIAHIMGFIKKGSAAGTGVVEVYLITADDTSATNYGTDNAGASDAAWTATNAKMIGSIATDASTNTKYGDWIIYNPGLAWTIGIMNESGAAFSSTEADCKFFYAYEDQEIQ